MRHGRNKGKGVERGVPGCAGVEEVRGRRTFRMWHDEEQADAGGADAVSKQRDTSRIAAEPSHVAVHPAQRRRLVQQTVVARQLVVARRQESCAFTSIISSHLMSSHFTSSHLNRVSFKPRRVRVSSSSSS